MKIVLVKWRDTLSLDKGWLSIDQAVEEGQKESVKDFITVGYLIHKGNFILVAATWDGEKEYNDISIIPKSSVIRIEKI